jgi:hypothetical protein
MSEIKPPRDAFGSELHVGDIVAIQSTGVVVFKVIQIQNGGLHTSNGQTPALVRIVADITIGGPAGSMFNNVVKCVSPGAEDALKRILEASPPPSA